MLNLSLKQRASEKPYRWHRNICRRMWWSMLTLFLFSMGGASSRTKGHSFERFVAQQFRDAGWPDAKTTRQADPLSDPLGCDIAGVAPFKPQCKSCKRYAPLSAIEEIQGHVRIGSKESFIPLLITKGNHLKPIACLYLSDFLAIIKSSKLRPCKRMDQAKVGNRNP